jgi:hypothetical protein
MNSDEGKAAHTLLEAVEAGDQGRVTALVSKSPFIYLDNEVARTAKQLKAAATSNAGGGDDLR